MGPPHQATLDYLNQVMNQRGPQAVPYAENVKWTVREHLAELQKVFPTLSIKASDFHTNDGRLLHVLKADGTIPIHFQGAKYNIPIVVWVLDQYPYSAPLVYVTPTSNMVIKPGHPFVDSSGQVSTPTIRSWRYPNSNLVELTLEMVHFFGSDPPLYSQPSRPVQPPPAAYPPPSSASFGPQGYPAPAGSFSSQQSYPVSSGSSIQGYPPSMSGGSQMYPPPSGASQTYPVSSSNNSGYPPTPSSTQQYPPPSNSFTAPAPRPGPPAPSGSSTSSSGAYPAPSQYPDLGTNPMWGSLFGMPPAQPRPPPPGPAPGPQPPSATASAAAAAAGGPYTYNPAAPGGAGPRPPTDPNYPGFMPPAAGYPNLSGGSFVEPPPPAPAPAPPKVTKAELHAQFKPLAVAALRSKLEAAATAYTCYCEQETDRALEVQRTLSERKAKLVAMVNAYNAERASTEVAVREMGSKSQQLQAWLERNETKANIDPASIDISKAYVAADEYSNTAMQATAEDLACEDAIVMLDKALQGGVIQLDTYLKQVRSLCRKQYFARALGIKVSQIQPPPPPVAAAAAPPRGTSIPYPVAHGDSWSHAPPSGMLQNPLGVPR